MSVEANIERLFRQLICQNHNTTPELQHLYRQQQILEEALDVYVNTSDTVMLRILIQEHEERIEAFEALVHKRNLHRLAALQREYRRLMTAALSYRRRMDRCFLHDLRTPLPARMPPTHYHYREGAAADQPLIDAVSRASMRTLNTQYGQLSGRVPRLSDILASAPWLRNVFRLPPASLSYGLRHPTGPVYNIESMIYSPEARDQAKFELPSYNKVTKLPCRRHKICRLSRASRERSIEEIIFNPRLHCTSHPPRYTNARDVSIAEGNRQHIRSEVLSSSSDDVYDPLLHFAQPLAGIRHMSSSFNIDPRTRYSSYGAQALGIMRQTPETINAIRPRGETFSGDDSIIHRVPNEDESPLLRARGSLEMIYDPGGNDPAQAKGNARRLPSDQDLSREGEVVMCGNDTVRQLSSAMVSDTQLSPTENKLSIRENQEISDEDGLLLGRSDENSERLTIGPCLQTNEAIRNRAMSSSSLGPPLLIERNPALLMAVHDCIQHNEQRDSFDLPERLEAAHAAWYAEIASNWGSYDSFLIHEHETLVQASNVLLPDDASLCGNSFSSMHPSERPNRPLAHESDTDFEEGEARNTMLSMRQYISCLRGGSSLKLASFAGIAAEICGTRFFINSRGNEYFCDIDEEYLTDRFNLTSLNTEVQYYQYALDLVTDMFDLECDDDMREQIEKSARHLYGLVHARYIVTTRGLQKMCEKFKNGDFGKCPRVACDGQHLLPMGQNDTANVSAVKLYCARCEDLYNPKSSRHASVDGAYFGTSFHNMFLQVYPNLMPPKTQRRYEPRVFGFRMHAAATLARWQAEQRQKMKERLRADGLETGFEEEERDEEVGDSEGEDEGQDGIDDMFEGQRVAQSGHVL